MLQSTKDPSLVPVRICKEEWPNFFSEFQITFQEKNDRRKIAYDDNQMYLFGLQRGPELSTSKPECLPTSTSSPPSFGPASDTLYQSGHHGIWHVLTKLPNALVTNSFTCYTYTSVATSTPPHCLTPCLCISRPVPNALFSRLLSLAPTNLTGYNFV